MSRQFMRQSANPGVLMERGRGIFYDWGTLAELPAAASIGYAPGCIFVAADQSAWNNLYVNNGTAASSLFQKISAMPPSGISSITIAANTVNAFDITNGTTNLIDVDTRNTVTGVTAVTVSASAPTIASATGDTFSQFGTAAKTVTLTGTTTVTALDGLGVNIGVVTVTDASAVTVSTISGLYVGLPVVGGSVTGTKILSAHFAGQIGIDAGGINLAPAAQPITVKTNTAAVLTVKDGTTAMLSLDSRNTLTGANTLTILSSPNTIASAAAVHQSSTLVTAAKTVTYTGTNTVTSNLGAGAYLDTVTFTDASAGTITTVSNLHIAAIATAGGSLTLTNRRMISTGVADCYLTNAGVFTDTASTAAGKEQIEDAETGQVFEILDSIKPRSWKYKESFHGDDNDQLRVGIVGCELPEALSVPGRDKSQGIASGVIGSFALAALKIMRDEYLLLRSRLEKLEAVAG